mgnify:CR=1 FL=1
MDMARNTSHDGLATLWSTLLSIWPLILVAFLLVVFLFSKRLLPSVQALRVERFQIWVSANYLVLLIAAVGLYFFTTTLPYLNRLPLLLSDLFQLLDETVEPSEEDVDQKAAIRGIAYAIGTPLAVLALAFAILFTIIRIWLTERTTQTSELDALSDRFQRAADQLGAVQTVNHMGVPVDAPNIEVRIAALLFLEKLAQANRVHYLTIIELICVYVRQNKAAQTKAEDNITRPDVDIAFRILHRRSELDLAYDRKMGFEIGTLETELRPDHVLGKQMLVSVCTPRAQTG